MLVFLILAYSYITMKSEKKADLSQYHYTSMNESYKLQLFDSFAKLYNRSFNKMERYSKFQLFKLNLKAIDDLNIESRQNGGVEVNGITKFADTSRYDFLKYFLGCNMIDESDAIVTDRVEQCRGEKLQVDWTETLTTVVNDQGPCACSWAKLIT